MLKALELIGFKSFADRTRFEFPPGITVIVGPNGSGKSNVVDAVKWVLGEQSAKSLRGSEMADVIFKGAGAAGRRVVNTAEATIVFDNAAGRLSIDAPEVHVTRRVYRSGEGEYLINRQPCRLKDVRDLFRGTGVGADAYSLIEQGKVDGLLQASPRDRRAIFEEAAGISRFKAKKVEAQRRLERVDQNLLRLSDIVQEVESRLRSVRAQASKARRYRQHAERLQQLRIQVGLADWRTLTERLQAHEAEIQQGRRQADQMASRAEAQEARVLELETEIATTGERIHNAENQCAGNREDIASRESTIEHERARHRDLVEELAARRQQLLTINSRAGGLQQRMRDVAAQLADAENDDTAAAERLNQCEQRLQQVAEQFQLLRRDSDQRRSAYMSQMRALAALGNQLSGRQSHLADVEAQGRLREARARELAELRRRRATECEQSRQAEQQLGEQFAQQAAELETARLELAESRRLLIRRQEDAVERRGRLSGLRERATVLEELERKAEGIGAGAREIIQRARQQEGGPFSEVRGLVADVLRAPVDVAPLVDIALGAAAQYVLVAGDGLIHLLESGSWQAAGRVGLLRLDEGRGRETSADLEGRPGVIARADRAVTVSEGFVPIVQRLLGRTWFVETLADAISLRAAAEEDARFVTRRGHLVDRDGSVTLGPPRAAGGLVSRRSQLQQLKADMAALELQVAQNEQEVARLRDNLDRQEFDVRRRGDACQQLQQQRDDQRLQTRGWEDRLQQLEQEAASLQAELQATQTEQAGLVRQCTQLREQLGELENGVAETEGSIRAQDEQLEQLESQRAVLSRQATAAKVEAAKTEQRLESLQVQQAQFEERRRERSRAAQDTCSGLRLVQRRCREAERQMLEATSALAELYLRKQTLVDQIALLAADREQRAAERNAALQQLQQLRREMRQLEEQLHERELAAGEVRHQRTALEQRIQEDYGIELERVELDPVAPEQQQQHDTVEQEIADLRRKINRIGPVNMDALEELDALESRFESLSSQHRDLAQAKEALERIIQKINADSRRLFLETLDAIRQNFQALFRKGFGGGRADIVLEEGVDVLDAGVEIVATPPGKPSFNNSLLSGGEKALTAVALLLAIFQFRPSPFCVLDEVDAPFDEANIGRFIDVLKGFLGWTKFVIVTHSKKTMTAATTLYGVTMQESGVSKQVSVRFEDVSEDGHISREAIDRELPHEPADDERGAA